MKFTQKEYDYAIDKIKQLEAVLQSYIKGVDILKVEDAQHINRIKQLEKEIEEIKTDRDDLINAHKVADENRSKAMKENQRLKDEVKHLTTQMKTDHQTTLNLDKHYKAKNQRLKAVLDEIYNTFPYFRSTGRLQIAMWIESICKKIKALEFKL